jgi:hypothetical protein
MTIGAAPRGPGSLAWTIQILPSPELATRSWHWPQSRHAAFDLAVSALAIAAATCILDGRPFGGQQVKSPICDGCLTYTLVRRGDGVLITITDFSGPQSPDPDWPGPNGGASQPKPAAGLVVGLRGAGRYYRMVEFHGFMVPIPATNISMRLSRDFGHAVLFNNDDEIPLAAPGFAFDAALAACSFSPAINSLRFDIPRSDPCRILNLSLSPSTNACDWGGTSKEQLQWTISDRKQRYSAHPAHRTALRNRQRRRQTRPGASPGRYLH